MCPSTVAKGDVITFGGLDGGNNSAFAAYTEGPFTVTPITANWFQNDTTYGDPAPSIYEGPLGDLGPGEAEIQVTATFYLELVRFLL
jgi:hypothetical protein